MSGEIDTHCGWMSDGVVDGTCLVPATIGLGTNRRWQRHQNLCLCILHDKSGK